MRSSGSLLPLALTACAALACTGQQPNGSSGSSSSGAVSLSSAVASSASAASSSATSTARSSSAAATSTVASSSGPSSALVSSSSASSTSFASSSVMGTSSSAAPGNSSSSAMSSGSGPRTYTLDFATADIENPLSAGGVWTNNTQGTGGNQPPGNLTSLQVGLASDGQTRIAFDTHEGINYDDSFAFVPGFDGDQYVEAVIYKEPGYNANAAGANHEIELLLGCSSGVGVRTWNEFLINSGGGIDILFLDGGPSGFQSLGLSTSISAFPVDGDTIRAERVGNVLSLYLNGTLWGRTDLTASPQLVARGSGIGLAAFIRPGAVHNKFGFRRVTMGTL